MRKQQKLFFVLLFVIVLISTPFLESMSWAIDDRSSHDESTEQSKNEAEKEKEKTPDGEPKEETERNDKSNVKSTKGKEDTKNVNHQSDEKQSKNKAVEKSPEKSAESKDNPDKQSSNKPSHKETDEPATDRQPIQPFVGNHNIDIDLSPYKKEVLSGNDAIYQLVLKVTGSQTTYTDASVTIDLPIGDYTDFTQDLNELMINGVQPTYDDESQQLNYEFDELKSGRTYETLININTTNGETPNNTELKAEVSFEANEQEKLTDDATVLVKASNSLAVSKQFTEARLSGDVQKVPFPGSYTIWDIKVNIPKKDVGQLFLKEGSKITVTDTFSDGLTYYDVMGGTPEPDRSGRTLTWEFDAPTIMEQAEAEGDLYTLDLRVRLQVNDNENLIGTTQENEVTVEATTIDDNTITKTAKDEIPIVDREATTGEIEGGVMYPNHFGPADGKGNGATSDEKDPNPTVNDDAYLQFRHGITPMHPGLYYDYDEFRIDYKIDDNLLFNNIRTPGNFYFARSQAEARQYIPLAEQPEFNIVGRVNGSLKILATNADHGTVYTRADLGLTNSDDVSEIRLNFTKAPAGMYARQLAHYYFDVKPGYTGQVKNEYNVRTIPNQQAIDDGLEVNDNGTWWYKRNNRDTWDRLASDRHATIEPKPTEQPPIATVGIELINHENGEVVHGENRMKITLRNELSSPKSMDGPLESVVLLPPGVTLFENPTATFKETNGNNAHGNYEILEHNYNGTGRQLVKVTWNDQRLRTGQDVTAELDVDITKNAPSLLTFDVYGFSGEGELNVPSGVGELITDTILQTDDDDLNGNGVTDEPRLKSGNIYTMRGEYNLQTEKYVRGELDNEWSQFGQTVPEGSIDYRLKLTNTTGKDLTKMVLMDVLPSEGDLGITDNFDRGSQLDRKSTRL